MKVPDLLTKRQFLPLFVTQFLGAFNDNLFKTALAFWLTYAYTAVVMTPEVLLNVAQGLFILPFVLFSSFAGELADKYEKTRLVRYAKVGELLIVIAGILAFYFSSVYCLLGTLFLLGVQSAFFGPVKYALLPELLKEEELLEANSWFEFGTFLAILGGTVFAGIAMEWGMLVTGGLVLLVAIIGIVSAVAVPEQRAASPELKLNFNPVSSTLQTISYASKSRTIISAILGISWFWALGATFVAQFPMLVKDVLLADKQLVTVFLALFSLGIGGGTFLCNSLLRGQISPRYVPFGAFGISIFLLDFVWGLSSTSGLPASVGGFIAGGGWRLCLDLFMIAVCGGFYIVPLYALMLKESDASYRARIIAANNIINSGFIVASSLVISAAFVANFSISEIFYGLLLTHLVVCLYIVRLLPHEILKSFGRSLFRVLFRVEIKGLENYDSENAAVIVVNHTSFIDAPLLGSFLPDLPLFAVNTFIARKWWVKPSNLLFDLLPLDSGSPMAVKRMVDGVKRGKKLLIFPEGRITVTGSLMKVYEGPAMVASRANVPIIPIRIEGAQYSYFSKLGGKVRRTLFPKITITIMPPQKMNLEAASRRDQRRLAGQKLYDIMSEALFETCADEDLFTSLIRARDVHGSRKNIVVDPKWQPLSYTRLISGAFALGRGFKENTSCEYVGLLLPNSVAGVAAFFALQAIGKVPAMLNFSHSEAALMHCVEICKLDVVYTSRLFIRTAGLEDLVTSLTTRAKVIYLEDVAKEISIIDKLVAFLKSIIPYITYDRMRGRTIDTDAAAVVLFTSGSEGMPKGVMLSHRNLQANRAQVAASIAFNPQDRVFNALPFFHSFGLTVGTLLPILSGMQVFMYPSPLHYRVIPELIYSSDATIAFGTDTFLRNYAKYAHPYDFHQLRLVFSGAEPLKASTRELFADKFGIRVLEGYGATETAPVLAMNTPMHYRAGSVGRLLPGIKHELETVDGIESGGRLKVAGPNIMKGYVAKDGVGEWYDTGDIVEFDEEGFVFIKGRAKRFAKIAGEMVSLAAVEGLANKLWPESNHAAIAKSDEKKGEKIILVTDCADANIDDLRAFMQRQGANELMQPRELKVIAAVPVLGTGKVDYVELARTIQ